MKDYIKKYLPIDYGFDHFEVQLPSGKKLRIYKMDYTFSSMGEEYVIRYYVSRSNLPRWQKERSRLIRGNYEDFLYDTTPSDRERKRIIGSMLKKGTIRYIE